VKQGTFAYVNHARIRSWNQPVLSNKGKYSVLTTVLGLGV